MLVLVGFRAASRLFCVEAKYLSASRLFCVMVARRLLCVVAKHLSAYRLFCVMIAHRLFCVKAKHLSASRLFCVMIASRLFCVKGQLPLRLSIVLGEGQQSPFFASCSLTTNFFRNRLSLFFFFLDLGGIFFFWGPWRNFFFLVDLVGFFWRRARLPFGYHPFVFFCKQPLAVPLVLLNHQTPFFTIGSRLLFA